MAVTKAVLGLCSAGVIFALVSGLWQHTSAATAASPTELSHYGTVSADIGAAAATLIWLAVFGQFVAVDVAASCIANVKEVLGASPCRAQITSLFGHFQ